MAVSIPSSFTAFRRVDPKDHGRHSSLAFKRGQECIRKLTVALFETQYSLRSSNSLKIQEKAASKLIAGGRFAEVFEVNMEGGIQAALKVFKDGPDKEFNFSTEIQNLLAVAPCRYFPTLYAFSSEQWTITMQLAPPDAFEMYIKEDRTLEIGEIRTMARQLLDALCYLKRLKIIHKDLKPENISFQNKRVFILDLGGADRIESHYRDRRTGTPKFMAPEMRFKLGGYSFPLDMWSVGCVLYELYANDSLLSSNPDLDKNIWEYNHRASAFLGSVPPHFFEKSPLREIQKYSQKTGVDWARIIPREPIKSMTGNILEQADKNGESAEDAAELASLLHAMLRYAPMERITPEEALLHPFFTGPQGP